MAYVLGINAVFHDPAAALVVDGEIVAAAEEERFTRRKHGKPCVPFSTWELPEQAMRWCLTQAGLQPADLDAISYSYDPRLSAAARMPDAEGRGGEIPLFDEQTSSDPWEPPRSLYAQRAPQFVRSVLGETPAVKFDHVAHHVAHAASAYLGAGFDETAVLVLDGRGEAGSHLGGHVRDGKLKVLASQALPHSIGLLYEEVTEHLGFRRSSDEYKVMALASYGDRARFREAFDACVCIGEDGGFRALAPDLGSLVPARRSGEPWTQAHADLAAAAQECTERLLLALARWLHERTGSTRLAMAGGVALNCVANGRLAAEGPFEDIWVQPAAGDAGTALGAALWTASRLGDRCLPMQTAALGRAWRDDEIRAVMTRADIAYEQPDDLPGVVAETLAANGVVGWFEGRSEFGPRALGHRSLLVDPRKAANLQRMNEIKGREEFRPVAPVVLAERAGEIFDGVLPSPYMLFVHRIRDAWLERIPAVAHVDGTARVQTADRRTEPLLAAVLDRFDALTGVPLVVNTSFNTAGRPMVDSPLDALECFGAYPIDLLAMPPFVVRRHQAAAR